MKKILPLIALSFVLTFGSSLVNAQASPAKTKVAVKAFKTELYFGRSVMGGSEVSDEQWAKFLADEVETRFPDGFTVIDAFGQWKGGRERSKVLIVIYPADSGKLSGGKLDEIRDAYKKAFNQQAVLRIDITKGVKLFL